MASKKRLTQRELKGILLEIRYLTLDAYAGSGAWTALVVDPDDAEDEARIGAAVTAEVEMARIRWEAYAERFPWQRQLSDLTKEESGV